MTKVLFVCLGNICRSPLAEAIFNDLVLREGLTEKFMGESSGTSDYHLGEQADERAIEKAREYGLIIDHAARQFNEEDFFYYDYIITMDKSNLDHVKMLENSINGNQVNYQLAMMRDFDDQGKGEEVPDPYFGGIAGFQKVFDILYRSNRNFLAFLKEKQVGL